MATAVEHGAMPAVIIVGYYTSIMAAGHSNGATITAKLKITGTTIGNQPLSATTDFDENEGIKKCRNDFYISARMAARSKG